MYVSMYISPMPRARRYSIAEARASLPAIVDQAQAGREIELTRRGRPVAVVLSLRELERLRAERPRFSAVYARFLERFSLAEVGVEADFFVSLRKRGSGRAVDL